MHRVISFLPFGNKQFPCLNSMKFSHKNSNFIVIATTTTGDSPLDVLHAIKNTTTGEVSHLTISDIVKSLSDQQ